MEVSVDFASKFLINSRKPITNTDFQYFLNYYPKFREKFEKFRQNFDKAAKFSLKFSKIAGFYRFSTKILINSPASGSPPPEPHTNAYF